MFKFYWYLNFYKEGRLQELNTSKRKKSSSEDDALLRRLYFIFMEALGFWHILSVGQLCLQSLLMSDIYLCRLDASDVIDYVTTY